jgi:hypothetical protein
MLEENGIDDVTLSAIMLLSAIIQTNRTRADFVRNTGGKNAIALQRMHRKRIAKRRLEALKYISLQQKLSGILHRNQAQKMLMNLQDKNAHEMNIRVLCSVMETLVLRKQHFQSRESQAVSHIQRCGRGMVFRKKTNLTHLRVVALQRLLHRCLRRYQARGDVIRLSRGKGAHNLGSVICAVMQTMRLRARYHMVKKRRNAVRLIQRHYRGFRVRKRFAVTLQQNRENNAKRLFRGVVHRYQARKHLARVAAEAYMDRMGHVFHCIMYTLQMRVKHREFKQMAFFSRSAIVIQKNYRSWSTRRRPGVRSITQSIKRVHLENQDRSLQRRHAAASMIQAVWRSWISRQVLLLPKVIHYLTLERTKTQESRLRDVCSLQTFRSAGSTKEKAKQIMFGAAQITNMSISYYGIERRRPFRNWSNVVDALEKNGEQLMELDFGKQHAIAACTNGTVYTYTNPETFTQEEDAVLTEEDFVLAPLTFRESLKEPAPQIIKVACGDRHALLLSDKGLIFTWGMNNRGQCGVGTHLPERSYLSATCLHKWGHAPTVGIQALEPSRAHVPRVKAIACGANHCGIVDAEGQLWYWGEHQAIGLFHLKPVRGDMAARSFLLFRMSEEIHKRVNPMANRAQSQPLKSGTRTPLGATPRQISRTSPSGQALQTATLREPLPLEQEGNSTSDIAFEKTDTFAKMRFNFSADEMGSLRAMLTEAQAVVAVKEVSGDVFAPTLCCNIVLCPLNEATRLRAAGTPVVDCWLDGWCAPIYPAPARGVMFDDLGIGPGVNTALSNRGYVYSWGRPERGLLGRPVKVRHKPAAPERLPFFPQLAIALTSVSVGLDHVIALTTHGRVFTWGKVDACLGPSGFQRCTLEEPMFVEGVLRELRVVQVAAGRLESVIATEGFDAVIGWDMLEMSNVGHRMLPVAYQYTLTGPRSGFMDARFERLKMVQSEAVQCLVLGGKLPSGDDHLHGLDPFPHDDNPHRPRRGQHFMKKNDGHKKRTDALKPRVPKRPVARGVAHSEMFQWAEKANKYRKQMYTDPRLKRAAATMVSPSFAVRQRDILEVERDLAGFRRLALSRQDSNVIGVSSDDYKVRNYDAHEEVDPGTAVSELASSLDDSVDGTRRRLSTEITSHERRSTVGSVLNSGRRSTVKSTTIRSSP